VRRVLEHLWLIVLQSKGAPMQQLAICAKSSSACWKYQEQQCLALRTRKSVFHFWSPGGVRRRHAMQHCSCHGGCSRQRAPNIAAAAADAAATVSQYVD